MPRFVFIWLGLLVIQQTFSLYRGVVNAETKDALTPVYSGADVKRLYYSGLKRLTAHAHSAECKSLIEVEYMKHLQAIAEERPFPFENILFSSLCPSLDRKKVLVSDFDEVQIISMF